MQHNLKKYVPGFPKILYIFVYFLYSQGWIVIPYFFCVRSKLLKFLSSRKDNKQIAICLQVFFWACVYFKDQNISPIDEMNMTMIPLKTNQFYFLYMFSDSQNVQYIDKCQYLYSPMVACDLQTRVAIVSVSQ